MGIQTNHQAPTVKTEARESREATCTSKRRSYLEVSGSRLCLTAETLSTARVVVTEVLLTPFLVKS